MRTNLMICLCALIPLSAVGDEPKENAPNADNPEGWLRTIDWQDEFTNRNLPEGMAIEQDSSGTSILSIEGSADVSGTIPLVIIEEPGVNKSSYCLSAMIRYEDVSVPGYLEMWNHFGDSETYFTRTLGVAGPMGKIAGSSEWRELKLPFLMGSDRKKLPTSLEVNLILPSKGKVWLSEMTLIEADSPQALALGYSGSRMAGIVCGTLGAVFGCLGGLYGWSRNSGRWWSVMQFFPRVCYYCGAVSFILAGMAYLNGWGWAVVYFSALFGLIILIAVAGNEWYYRQLHGEANPLAEERRMRSLDV